MYENGNGVTQDYNEAKQWYEKAAEQGEARAQLSLGFMYAQGHGVRQSFDTAREMFGRACDLGLQEGCEAFTK